MKTLFFSAGDYPLIAFILALPLLGAFVNGVFGQRLGKSAVRVMALAVMGVAFAAAVATFVDLNHVTDAMKEAGTKEPHAKLSWLAWEWMKVAGPNGGRITVNLAFSVDALSGVMMLVVTGVGLLIHVYASEYMIEDKGYWRFFCYLNLFVFSMLVLILGDSLPVLFVGWEGVGLCSYLLIGFWYGKMPNATAGKKAFIANRVGDFGLIVAMFLLAVYCGSLDWDGIARNAHELVPNSERPNWINLWPIGGGRFEDFTLAGIKLPLHKLQPDTPVTMTAATAVALMLFLGATGKSAQLPLYVWLPDAMAGPTPVSALIHAATMVTAGIYLICRLSMVFVLAPAAMITVAFTGALTALLAATIALVQNDIKKVLAYSTVSQLGYMVLGVGVGAFTAGFFHVFTHAFFKACLFLGAGSVIHAMHARIHDDDRSQDMRNMGGLKDHMPWTFRTFVASTLCIIGFPLTSGFFSKDEIIARTLIEAPAGMKLAGKVAAWQWPSWANWALWGIAVLTALLTAFYMCRVVFLTFFGDFKGWTIGRPKAPSHVEEHDHDHGHDDDDDEHHHHDDLSQPGPPPHESPWAMTIPLIVLAALAVFAGILNPTAIKVFSAHFEFLPLDHWLSGVFHEAEAGVKMFDHDVAHSREVISSIAAFLAFAVGAGGAYWVYILNKGKPARELMLKVPALYRLVLDKWRVDELYDKTAVNAVDALADTASSVDQGIVDFILARLTALVVAATGTVLRVLQNGVVHVYAAVMVLGLGGLMWFFVEPHADFTVEEKGGEYSLTAGPGPGYGFKWYPDATKEAQTKDFDTNTQLKLRVPDGESRTVKLEVKNAFGRVATKDLTIKRPAAAPGPSTIRIQEK
ncbi:MAG: NADH-quinone oxidoreductase subunit L [Labilithrix sp.]|nr:NADH-quinone oxidoreductase subunit L [Labilithrix sp.]MCW5816834.1 NADH-quinone oxidoreductase subunit L [Labilithrix sp.]